MVEKDNDVGVAMALVIGAGAATGLGAAVVFFPSLVRFANNKTLAAALGLSAGVMTYVSFAEIFIKSQDSFQDADFSEDQSKLYATLCFFAGVVTMVALNHVVTCLLGVHHHHHHHGENRNTTDSKESMQEDDEYADDESESIPPCICHDEHPRETWGKVRHMANSMADHPDRPHPHGLHQHQDEKNMSGSMTHDGENEPLSDEEIASRQPPQRDIHTQETAAPSPERTRSQKSEVNIPQADELSEMDDKQINGSDEDENQRKLMAMSLNTALAIGLHNFPEGLATFVAALEDPKVGAVLAIAIAIHNIPEGLCVAMPIYYATGNKWKAFGWACLSGIAEPIAGLLGWLILSQSFSDQLYALLFGMVAGMMVIISVRELLPTAHRYDPEDSVVTYAFITGMGIMALSLMLFLL